MNTLIGPREVMQQLGLKSSHFYKLQARGFFKCCEAPRPIGRRRYLADRIQRWRDEGTPTAFSGRR